MSESTKNTSENNITETDSTVSAASRPAAAEEEKTPNLVIKLRRPYGFEDKSYTEIDLRKMEELNGGDLFKANKIFLQEGYLSNKPETDPKFCYTVASLATGLPLEFFTRLPIRTANRVKETVYDFFQGED